VECGETQYLCQLLTIISENELAEGGIAKLFGEVSLQAFGVIGAVGEFLKEYGEKLIAAFAFSFGVWKWWVYRERILHKRLEEYLKESDARLANGMTGVLTSLQRPGPSKPPKLPLFATSDIRSAMRVRRWHRMPMAPLVAASAQWQLDRAIEKVERKLQSGESMMSSLRKELATANIMKGAISASGARIGLGTLEETKIASLNSFRSALQVPGHEHSVIAKEFEAHQLRDMQHFERALDAYRAVEELAPQFSDYRTQQLTIARAKRYQAEMLQLLASKVSSDGNREFSGVLGASNLLRGGSPSAALNIRGRFAPYQGWDLLEQGDMELLTAFLAHNLGNLKVESGHLEDAETAFRSILATTNDGWLETRHGNGVLRVRARAGLESVQLAKEKQFYEWLWLVRS
jgi:hypothetical protein